jgi:hypothetical protein
MALINESPKKIDIEKLIKESKKRAKKIIINIEKAHKQAGKSKLNFKKGGKK